MTSVHLGHIRTYWDPHQTRYSSRTDLLKQQHPDRATWSTDQTHIGQERSETHTAIEHMRIKICDASIVTAGLCPPIEHPTWVASLHARGSSHRSGERGRRAAINDMHEPDEWSCISSIATLIRHVPRPWEGPRSVHQRPPRPPRPPFLECRLVLFKKASYGCTYSLHPLRIIPKNGENTPLFRKNHQ